MTRASAFFGSRIDTMINLHNPPTLLEIRSPCAVLIFYDDQVSAATANLMVYGLTPAPDS